MRGNMQFCVYLRRRASSHMFPFRENRAVISALEKFNESAIGDTVYREVHVIHDMRIH